jgi:hypothetical protein
LVLPDGEDDLHKKIDENPEFNKYYQEFTQFLDKIITAETQKTQISEEFRTVYIFAEIAAFNEGFKEGIRFLINVLSNVDESEKEL